MVTGGPDQHAGLRLPARAMIGKIVRAHVDAHDERALAGKLFLHTAMDLFQVAGPYLSEGDASLVRYDNDLESCLVKGSDGGENVCKIAYCLPLGNVLSLWRLLVDNAIAVKKDGLHGTGFLDNPIGGGRSNKPVELLALDQRLAEVHALANGVGGKVLKARCGSLALSKSAILWHRR